MLFSIIAVTGIVVPRYECNRTVRAAQERLDRIGETRDRFLTMELMRTNVAELTACEKCTPEDYRLHMYLGWSHYRVDRFAEAERSFAKGVSYQRRPELLVSLGLAQLHLGKREEALGNLTQAAAFRMASIKNIPYEDIRQIVQDRFDERERKLWKR
jgi:tetratricopeptide (TPR) repeat protein